MAKTELSKKPSWHGNILNTVKKNLLRLTQRETIELEAIHVLIKIDVSCWLKIQKHTL